MVEQHHSYKLPMPAKLLYNSSTLINIKKKIVISYNVKVITYNIWPPIRTLFTKIPHLQTFPKFPDTSVAQPLQ